MKKTKAQKLKLIRTKIDQIDTSLVNLLNKRAGLAKKTTVLKERIVYDPKREKQILQNLKKKNKGPIENEAMAGIYEEILSTCRGVQKQATASFLGPEGSHTHHAAQKILGRSASFVPKQTISEVFSSVELGESPCGIVPLENSLEGPVVETLDRLVDKNVRITSESHIKIFHCLMSKQKNLKKIKKIYSHPQAIGQCQEFIKQNLWESEIVEVQSTAKAAEIVTKESSAAAIAPEPCSQIYSLNLLKKNIQDTQENMTIFVSIEKAKKETSIKPKNKVSVAFSLDHRPGTLYSCLERFKKEKINLTKIQSRPSRKVDWDYLFFIDFLVDNNKTQAERCLEDLKLKASYFKILGVY